MDAALEDGLIRGLEDDGLYTPIIKDHSLEKIRLHNYYVRLFSTGMKNRWPQRAYLGLYSGPGRARVATTGEIVATTAMSALQVPDPFTKYIFVDNDPKCIEALEARARALDGDHDVSFVEKDVSEAVPAIVRKMPSYSKDRGLLSFCFVDPFSANLDFNVFRALGSRYRMDFLVLLMLGRDVRTNFQRYFSNESNTRIADLIADKSWRKEWVDRKLQPRDLVRFVLEKFGEAMTTLGYQSTTLDEAQPIRLAHGNVLQYYLVFCSRHGLGHAFWNATRQGVDGPAKPSLDVSLAPWPSTAGADGAGLRCRHPCLSAGDVAVRLHCP